MSVCVYIYMYVSVEVRVYACFSNGQLLYREEYSVTPQQEYVHVVLLMAVS